ncbi:hypothetical protein ASG01_00300 [Chryseobacterium sp. Leaf180]|uniref:ATP-binding protein n=1 Tax=Chryseobacterium sp. Leaf180 TaxID=1736289 RepID=UPI0006F79A46|nr:ATP-binding protein [Chryseobacterium sp. Leaf180]KQR94364.1 hypothetical protein ASG01_00300 [Chryseobacterium sp. Leaf180]
MPEKTDTNEQQRLQSLQSYHILDTAAEKDFDDITELASAICETPISLISLVDENRQWFKSRHGLDALETERCHSFCAHAILQPKELMEINDAKLDFRFSENPLVTGSPNIRFYAGMPLVDPDGQALGSLCVIDEKPKTLTEVQKNALRILANQVIDKLLLRKNAYDLEQANQKLTEANRELSETEAELKRSNTNLHNSKVRLQTILDIIGEGIGITDEVGNIVYTNKRNREIFKIEEGHMLSLQNGSSLWDNRRLDGSLLPREEHPVSIAVRTGKPVLNFEFLVRDRDGKRLYLRMNAAPITDENGKVTGAVANFADITQSYLLQQQLKEREESLRMAITSANLGTWHMNTLDKFFTPSTRLKELFGYHEDEEMTYHEAIAQIDASHREKVMTTVSDAMMSSQSYQVEFPVIGFRDRKLRWVHATGKLYKNPSDPSISHFSGTIADITERKLDEQRRSDFVGMVSHELRNPLTAINGYTYILNKRASKEEDAFTCNISAKISVQIKRMEALINGFLDVARLGEGKIQLNETQFELSELLKFTEEECLANITSHEINFDISNEITLLADREKIEQVITNFINNAVKYSPRNTEIKVVGAIRDGVACVSVRDHGMGISPQDQPFVFDRYYRVDSEEMKNKKGFGMGLYICREIIERHNGEIGVESTIGEGSTFWFTLPVNK